MGTRFCSQRAASRKGKTFAVFVDGLKNHYTGKFPLLTPVEPVQCDQADGKNEIPVEDDPYISGREIIMLNRMQDVRKACAPHKYRFGDDERQPNGLVPKPKKANDADPDEIGRASCRESV